MKSAAAISRQLQSQRQKIHRNQVNQAKKISKVSNSHAHAHSHYAGGTSTTAGSPSSTLRMAHPPQRVRHTGPYRDTMGLQPMRPRKNGFTFGALRGKITVHCIWAACKAMSIGIVFIAIGATLMAVGFYADQLSVKGKTFINGTVLIKRDRLRYYHLSNMSYVGPIVMGIGGFVILAACLMTFESREVATKIVPIKHKKKTVDSTRVNMQDSDQNSECSPAIDFSKAFANLNRAALTSAFIQFSGTQPQSSDSKTNSKYCDDKTNLISRKSPSEPVLGRPCYICNTPENLLNHCTNCHRYCESLPCDSCNKCTVIRRAFSIDNHNMESREKALSIRGLLPSSSSGANTNKVKRKTAVEEFPLLDSIVPMAEQEEYEEVDNYERGELMKTSSEDSVPMDVILADCSITVKVTVEPHGDGVIHTPVGKRTGYQQRPRTLGDISQKKPWNNGSVIMRKCSPGGESVDFSDDNTESTTDYCDTWGEQRRWRNQSFMEGMNSSYPVIRQTPVQPTPKIQYKLTRHK